MVGVAADCSAALGGAAIINAAAGPSSAPPVGSWTQIALEGQGFAFSGAKTVRYGSGSAEITQRVGSSGSCTNAFFRNDPLLGVAKRCEVPV